MQANTTTSYDYYRLVKESDGHAIIGTPHEPVAREIAQACALAWRRNVAVIRVHREGARQESETVALYAYRKLLHEEQAYDTMARA